MLTSKEMGCTGVNNKRTWNPLLSGVSYIVSFYCRVKKGFFVGNLLFFVDNYVENLKIASTMFILADFHRL